MDCTRGASNAPAPIGGTLAQVVAKSLALVCFAFQNVLNFERRMKGLFCDVFDIFG